MAIQICGYHALSEQPLENDVYTLALAAFEHQLQLLQNSGVPVLPADPEEWARSAALPGNHAGITFDDGCRSDLAAAELLEKHGKSAMFFISTANIGRPGYLDATEIRHLEAMGMAVGSHSHEHIQLTTMGIDEARRQMRESKDRLEDILGHAVKAIAFPGGSYNKRIVDAAVDIGFRYVLTTDWGTNRHQSTGGHYLFKRNNILRGMSDDAFSRLVTLKSSRHRQLVFFLKQALRTILPPGAYQKIRGAL